MPKMTEIPYKRLMCVFEKDGFVYSRTEGSHMSFKKDGIPRALVIPRYRNVPVFIIENLLKTAKMSRDRYFQLLAEC